MKSEEIHQITKSQSVVYRSGGGRAEPLFKDISGKGWAFFYASPQPRDYNRQKQTWEPG